MVVRAKILGAGPTGSMLAIAFASVGTSVSIYDPFNEKQLLSRSRAYAITHSSRRLLQRLNLWQSLEGKLIPFSKLSIQDRETSSIVTFNTSDLSRNNRQSDHIGWILDHTSLMEVLFSKLNTLANVEVKFESDSDLSSSKFDMVFAADGPTSPSRESLGIKSWMFKYNQGCLTAKVILRGVDSGTAYELFRAEGPLAILPMGGEVFQIVWSAPYDKCLERASFESSRFLDALSSVLPDRFEPDLLVDNPTAFPLKIAFANSFYRGNVLLVGESCHSCHPVGGQGLNLCWRDVSCLMFLMQKVNTGCLAITKLSKQYRGHRFNDLIAVGILTDLVVRLFSNRSFILLLIRTPMMSILSKSSLLRKLLLKTMTDGPISLFK